MDQMYEIIKKLPKADLHRHLDGSLRTQTIYEVARERNYPLPAGSVDELGRYVQVSEDCRSLADFLKAFNTFYPLLMNPDVMERAAYEVSEDAYNDNVKYCELRFAPVLQAKEGFSMEDILAGVLKGLKKAHEEFNIINPLILCCYRSESPESSLETVKLAIKYRDKGIVAVDLAGDEEHYPASAHKEAFNLARKNGIQITVHAGEAGSVNNIREAVEVLKTDRIGHGIHILDDNKLYQDFIQRQIPLEMCLTSNIQTTVVKSYEEHPFSKCFRDGLKVTINTDDPGVSNITLSHELYLLHKYYRFSLDEIKRVILNNVEASFTTKKRKALLKQEFEKEFESRK
ncbi:MAG: adenosine deaminase [bacterium]|nr:adenosine deaminase [bacterium]